MGLCLIQKTQTGFRCYMYFSFYSLAHIQQADLKKRLLFPVYTKNILQEAEAGTKSMF